MTETLLPDYVGVMARAHVGVIAQRSAHWEGVVGDLIVKGPTADHEVTVTPAVDTFFLTRSHDPHAIVKRLNREPPRALTHPGSLVNFIAAGDRLVTQVRHGNSGMDRLALSFSARALRNLRDAHDIPLAQLHSALLIDRPLPREILKAIADELVVPSIYGRLYVESLTLALLIDLHRHQNSQRRVAPIKGGLAPWQLRRVEEMIHEKLADDLSLADLAGITGLSKSHFARAFHRSTGLPPHQFQLNARVERAKHLLRRGDLSLTEIGIDCGFKEQSQFIRAFRRLAGVAPGVWQRMQKA
jgi:AraC family transcriptional regulator